MSQKIWFSVQVIFDYQEETKTFRFMNCNGQTVHKLRYQIINEGLQLPIDSRTWIVIFPWVIRSFTAVRQEKFFKEAQSDRNTTVFSADQTVNP